MLKTPVKASQITNLTDARYFAAREVEWLGFNLDAGTEGAIIPQQISAIKEWVEGPKIVGEFGLQSPDEIQQAVEYLSLEAIQIGMFADTKAIRAVIDIPILKEIIVEHEDLSGVEALMNDQSGYVDLFVLDFSKNGIAIEQLPASSQTLLQTLCQTYKILINIDGQVDQIGDFLQQTQPHGLILLGGEEEKVGYKSFEQLDDLLDFLEIEE